MRDPTCKSEERFRATSQRSRELYERGRKVMPGVAKGAYFHRPYPLTMARGEGCYLYDVDGHRYIDFNNHHTSNIVGHNHPAVMQAVRDQMQRGIAFGAPTGVETELAEEMCRRVASVNRIRFCNSGTEATLHAIRLARGFSKRPKIAKFEGAYHGSHDAVEVSVAPPLDKAGPASAPHAVPTAGGMSPHAHEDVIVLPYDDEAAVERLVSQHRDELACVILDPKAGIMAMPQSFVQAVREITRKNDVLLILDEIVAFRVNRGGFQAICGISPDLTTFGKMVGGGFPVGAIGGRSEIMDLFDNTGKPTGFSQSGTFSAHPVTMVAGLATLEQLTDDAFAHLNAMGDRLRRGLAAMFRQQQVTAQIVGVGSLFGIYFTEEPVTNYRVAARSNPSMVSPTFLSLLEQGFFLSKTLCMNGLSLQIGPEHIDSLIEAFRKAVRA